jgi:serine/threonine protein kinase
VASVYFTRSAFDLPAPPKSFAGLVLLGILLPFVWPGRFELTIVGGRVVAGIAAAIICYQVYQTIRLASTHPDRGGAISLAVAWLMIGATAWTDIAHWVELPSFTNGIYLASTGLLAFSLGLSALLMTRHTQSLKESKALNVALAGRIAELEAHGAEIESLNGELRRQINDKASHLVDALTLGGPSSDQALAEGDLVQDRYRVVARLGKGGMGTVWEVERVHDGKRLALKVPHAPSAETMARLAREAEIASVVSHSNVVGVVDVNVDASRGILFIVMDLARGSTLAAERRRSKDVGWALGVLEQIAEGVSALHRHGIVHRDLTPANVILTGDIATPSVKITDFGISRLSDRLGLSVFGELDVASHAVTSAEQPEGSTPPASAPRAALLQAREFEPHASTSEMLLSFDDEGAGRDATDAVGPTRQLSTGSARNGPPRTSATSSRAQLTRPGLLAGTPMYIAPELGDIRGARVSAPSDVFSFGVLAFEMLHGKQPFVESVVLAVVEGRPISPAPSLAALRPDLPTVATEVLDRCLAFDPALRPTADEVAASMRQARVALEERSTKVS